MSEREESPQWIFEAVVNFVKRAIEQRNKSQSGIWELVSEKPQSEIVLVREKSRPYPKLKSTDYLFSISRSSAYVSMKTPDNSGWEIHPSWDQENDQCLLSIRDTKEPDKESRSINRDDLGEFVQEFLQPLLLSE